MVWADGKISVNGKNVSQLFVQGKPFFGGDPVIAMRNLPKDAVDKVKVYDDKTNSDEFNVTKQVIMDVTLKKGIKGGAFGKAGGGLGTDHRREGNIALNYFSPKDQVSVMGATNNTNKQVFDVQSMLRQTVYKPGGNDNTGYQSNFTMEGLNQFKAGGISLSRDFTKTTNAKAEYFDYAAQNTTNRMFDDITSLTNNVLKQHTENKEGSSRRDQQLRGHYRNLTTKQEITIDPTLEQQNSNINSYSQYTTKNASDQLLNSSTNTFATQKDDQKLNLAAEYISKNEESLTQIFLLRYRLGSDQYTNQEQLKNIFDVSSNNSSSTVDRKKSEAKNMFNQTLYGELNLNSVSGYIGPFTSTLSNTLTRNQEKSDQTVNKFNTSDGQYDLLDSYLTNQSTYNYLLESPGLEITYAKRIVGIRNLKYFSMGIKSELQLVNQHNNSQKAFQQIDRNYVAPLPSLYFRFSHNKEGLFNKLYTIRYKTETTIPNMAQLAPLTDSAYQNYFRFGNPNLKQQYNHDLGLSYQNSLPNNGGIFKLNVNAGLTLNKFSDSSTYDNQGRRKSYTVNINGYRYINMSMSFEKSGKLFTNPFGIKLFPRVEFSKSPYYLDNGLKTSRNINANLLWLANYVQNDLLLYDIIGTVNYSKNTLTGSGTNNSFYSAGASTGASIQLSWPKHIVIVNTVSYDISANSYDKTIKNVIWNANLYCRLLKKEQLELKLTATDLLRQRSNIIRSINNNTLRTGTVNNLQQFFMVSLAYYPRQFGPSKKSKL
ncbi:hypothetical protein [Mucilaginibacter sp. UYCu711]|uniref:hypothetical protein n=1 Tax=Mucilaginibacter sp. UYCu711 TaxID=3156339 RepID=UPI003D2558D0